MCRCRSRRVIRGCGVGTVWDADVHSSSTWGTAQTVTVEGVADDDAGR